MTMFFTKSQIPAALLERLKSWSGVKSGSARMPLIGLKFAAGTFSASIAGLTAFKRPRK
jgi:hypothetical protein